MQAPQVYVVDCADGFALSLGGGGAHPFWVASYSEPVTTALVCAREGAFATRFRQLLPWHGACGEQRLLRGSETRASSRLGSLLPLEPALGARCVGSALCRSMPANGPSKHWVPRNSGAFRGPVTTCDLTLWACSGMVRRTCHAQQFTREMEWLCHFPPCP